MLQGVLQGIFVMAGLQLCAANRKQAIDKPARGALTFLIIGNLAVWLFKTFLVSQTECQALSWSHTDTIMITMIVGPIISSDILAPEIKFWTC